MYNLIDLLLSTLPTLFIRSLLLWFTPSSHHWPWPSLEKREKKRAKTIENEKYFLTAIFFPFLSRIMGVVTRFLQRSHKNSLYLQVRPYKYPSPTWSKHNLLICFSHQSWRKMREKACCLVPLLGSSTHDSRNWILSLIFHFFTVILIGERDKFGFCSKNFLSL